jgi:hypothetical protein
VRQSQGASQRFARQALQAPLRLAQGGAGHSEEPGRGRQGRGHPGRECTLPALKSAAEQLTLPGADTPASQGRTVLGACAQAPEGALPERVEVWLERVLPSLTNEWGGQRPDLMGEPLGELAEIRRMVREMEAEEREIRRRLCG